MGLRFFIDRISITVLVALGVPYSLAVYLFLSLHTSGPRLAGTILAIIDSKGIDHLPDISLEYGNGSMVTWTVFSLMLFFGFIVLSSVILPYGLSAPLILLLEYSGGISVI